MLEFFWFSGKCVVIACGDVIFLKKITMPSPPPSGAPLPKGEVSGVCVIELQTTILPGRAISTETTLHFSPMPLSGLLTLLGDLGLQEVTVTILPLEESPKPPGQIIFGFQSIDRHHRFLP